MEVKEWTYEELPEFTQEVEGAEVIVTTGDEMGVVYIPNVEYAEIDGVKLHLQLLLPSTRNQPEMVCPCVVFVQGSAWMPQDVESVSDNPFTLLFHLLIKGIHKA